MKILELVFHFISLTAKTVGWLVASSINCIFGLKIIVKRITNAALTIGFLDKVARHAQEAVQKRSVDLLERKVLDAVDRPVHVVSDSLLKK